MTARIVRKFMSLYGGLGIWRESCTLGEVWLKQNRAEPDDEQVLDVMDKLAFAYTLSGRSQESVELSEYILESSKKLFGDEHHEVISSMALLAFSYASTDPSKAVELAEQVVMIRTESLGEEHPDTLNSLDGLAVAYEEDDQPEKSLLLREKVLKIRTRILGEGHYDTLVSMYDLASSYRSVGRVKDGLTLLERASELSRSNLGDSHFITLDVMYLQSRLYYDIADREQDACRLAEQVVKLYKEVWGDDHPYTLRSEAWLAIILSQMKEERSQRRIGTNRENKDWVRKLSQKITKHLRLKSTS